MAIPLILGTIGLGFLAKKAYDYVMDDSDDDSYSSHSSSNAHYYQQRQAQEQQKQQRIAQLVAQLERYFTSEIQTIINKHYQDSTVAKATFEDIAHFAEETINCFDDADYAICDFHDSHLFNDEHQQQAEALQQQLDLLKQLKLTIEQA